MGIQLEAGFVGDVNLDITVPVAQLHVAQLTHVNLDSPVFVLQPDVSIDSVQPDILRTREQAEGADQVAGPQVTRSMSRSPLTRENSMSVRAGLKPTTPVIFPSLIESNSPVSLGRAFYIRYGNVIRSSLD